MTARVIVAALLAGCGPSFPPGWGEACAEMDDCATGMLCVSSSDRCMGEPPRCGRCEIRCADDGDCSGEMRCRGALPLTLCRVPCGPGFDPCPAGTACVDGSGCEPL